MCWPRPRSQAGAMNTNTVNPEARLRTDPPFGTWSRRTALRRPVQDSVVAGVAAGLAGYLGVDVMIIRLAFVVLTVFGGAGIPLYLARLLVRLARQPAWLLGIAAMIGGFVFQLTALRFGELALVQPILAAELLFVFGYLAVAGSRRPRLRDWLAAAAMSAGIGVFLRLAAPSGGRLHAPGSSWLLAGLVTAGVVLAALAGASGRRGRPGAARSRRAAVLGSATGISWGFMAAVIKELSAHLGDGIGAIVSAWSLYLLLAAGAATMLLAAHALAAGPLAASQPGFTIVDPLTASLLGVFLFGEHIQTGAAALAGEALALTVVIAGAT